jgi:hypothetical protein
VGPAPITNTSILLGGGVNRVINSSGDIENGSVDIKPKEIRKLPTSEVSWTVATSAREAVCGMNCQIDGNKRNWAPELCLPRGKEKEGRKEGDERMSVD